MRVWQEFGKNFTQYVLCNDSGCLRIKNRRKSGIKIEKFFSTKNLDISWLIKADDDIAINAELLAENLLTLNPSEDQIYCHVRWFPAPNRKGGSKW